MRILFLGRGSRGEVCHRALEEAGHTFVELVDNADLIVMANHNKILPKEVFSRLKYGAINCHAGKLPQYRGSSPLNWQIINGETEGAVSIIQVDEGIDTGDLIWERRFLIGHDDTIATVRETADRRFAELLPLVVSRIEIGAVSPTPQANLGGIPAYWHHRKPGDSRIDWQRMTAKQVHNLVRACEKPYVAFTHNTDKLIFEYEEPIVEIPKAKLLDDNFYGVPGRVVRRVGNGAIVIAADRGLWIEADLKVGEQLR